jgi:hypothetical protein
MWWFLQYMKDIWQDAIPWMSAVSIVTVILLIMAVAL